ncbi:MAG: GWxTD domain-containing protein [Bacteroidetes bacterium]|jgi:GWxTD domain-containing protein|nr:GWxTD domain-containing protein [Bacteroidota bacterium]
MWYRVVSGLLLGVILSAGALHAQSPASSPASAALAEAIDHQEAGEADEALRALRDAFTADPGYIAPDRGAVAYWLGRALLQRGAVDEAITVWGEGLQAMTSEGRLDLTLADAFVREVYARERVGEYAPAAETYLWLLRSLDANLDAEQEALVADHLEPLAWVLPDGFRDRVGLTALDATGKRSVPDAPVLPRDGAGALLANWWRGQDALPATPENERLHEHLARVAHANEHYRPDGVYDDRAYVYVRLGSPYQTTEIQFTSPEFLNKVVFRQLTLSSFDFPENEFWVYHHVDRSAYYLFVEDLDKYWLGTTNDLLPSQLRNSLTNSERGIRRSEALVRTLEEVYKELSLAHDDFAMRYQDVADYAELLDQQEMMSQAEMDRRATQSGIDLEDVPRDVSGIDINAPVRTDMLPELPHSFAMGQMSQADYEEGLAAKRREENVPEAYTELFRDVEALPVAVRTARFLEPDGATRTEVFWSVPPDGLTPSNETEKALRREGVRLPEPYLLLSTAVLQDEQYRDQARHINRHLVGSLASNDGRAPLQPQTYSIPDGAGTYHLAVQWDQRVAVMSGDDVVNVGPLVKREVFRVDSLQALDASGRTLELSDPLPLLLPEDGEDVVPSLEEATPYPYRRITNDLPLALNFEIYHLTFGPDDRTRYTVAYEVRREGGGGALRFLGRGDDEVTSARTTNTGTSRTSNELMLLDLSDWDGEGDLTVTLRVTDETTGAQVERSIDFELVEAR